ncbi:hypothetical protein [Baaleninema simplex]|uniref:hypothetical protein n=1 Tax=Baaleninema simplex TaxID=2862350 RepID=UPI000348450C|nr:hypothetical protein [Baaleninema simplex]
MEKARISAIATEVLPTPLWVPPTTRVGIGISYKSLKNDSSATAEDVTGTGDRSANHGALAACDRQTFMFSRLSPMLT